MRSIALESITAEDVRAWEQLASEAAEPNPFFEPGFVRIAAGALGADDVHLLVDDDAGAWRGCVPVRFNRVLGRPILAAGWKHPYSFLGTPLVTSTGGEGFAESLTRAVSARSPCRFALLRRASEGPVLAAIRAAVEAQPKLGVVFERSMQRPALERRDSFDYLSEMKSRRRSELRRQRRKLGEALGGEPTVRDRDDVAQAAEEFLRLEASGWKGESGTAMASDEASARLFRDVCAEFGGDDRIRFRSLEANGRVAAMTCDIVAGDVRFGFKAAYDEDLRRYSPGVQLQVDNFVAFGEHGPERLIDSCGEPDNEAMSDLWPERRSIATLAFGSRGATGWAVGKALERAYAAKSSHESRPASATNPKR
jgi:CelD/BcsL family acetyltransferase involved in cellulose biosynthesis